MPFILTGLRLAVGRALIGVMVGELYAATAGIGFMITVAGATFQTDKVFVGVLVFAITGMIMTDIIDRYERRFDKWRPRSARNKTRQQAELTQKWRQMRHLAPFFIFSDTCKNFPFFIALSTRFL